MKTSDVPERKGIKVGDSVVVVHEDGFYAGKSLTKQVERIVETDFSDEPEVAGRLGCPLKDIVWVFTDGSTAGCFDRVRKA